MRPLPADLDAELQRYMPGAVDGLDLYEWNKHGGCSGLPPERYFRTIVEAARQANVTIGAAMRDRAMFGRAVGVGELLDAVAINDPALARAIVVDCGSAAQTRPPDESRSPTSRRSGSSCRRSWRAIRRPTGGPQR